MTRTGWQALRVALSLGTCGLRVAFLVAHMPGAVERCGFPDSLAEPWPGLSGAGSLGPGLPMRHLDHARWLASLYLVRVAGVLACGLVQLALAAALAWPWRGISAAARRPAAIAANP